MRCFWRSSSLLLSRFSMHAQHWNAPGGSRVQLPQLHGYSSTHTSRPGRPCQQLGRRWSSQSPAAAGNSPSELLLTLEHPVGVPKQLDHRLQHSGVFSAVVHPELPIATTWRGLLKALRRGRTAPPAAAAAAAAGAAGQTDPSSVAAAQECGGRRAMDVETVGAQLRTMDEIKARVAAYCGLDVPDGPPPSHPPADALLMVSGSHPVRQLPLVNQVLPNSVWMLETASAMRAKGQLPASTALWATANPVVEHNAAYTAEKVSAGASVIVTQPPLDWGNFLAWLEDADRRGLLSRVRLVVGFPLLSSAANVGFWMALCNGSSNAKAQELAREFKAAEERESGAKSDTDGGPPFMEYAMDWNRQLLSQLLQLPGVAGLHFMPLSAPAKRIALQLIDEGALEQGPTAAGSSSSSSNASSSSSSHGS